MVLLMCDIQGLPYEWSRYMQDMQTLAETRKPVVYQRWPLYLKAGVNL